MHNRFSLARSMNVETGEGSTLFLLSLSLFLVIGSTAVIGRTVSRSFFLRGLPRQYIPVRCLAVTGGVVLTSLLYSRIAGRFRSPVLIQHTTLVMIGGLLFFRLLLNTPIAKSLWMLGSFYVFLEIVMALSVVQFWTFASEIFNTRQAKRLFPVVTGASNLGSMQAGASITVLVPLLGTANLLYIMVVMLAVNVFLVGLLGRRHHTLYDGNNLPSSASKQGPKFIPECQIYAAQDGSWCKSKARQFLIPSAPHNNLCTAKILNKFRLHCFAIYIRVHIIPPSTRSVSPWI